MIQKNLSGVGDCVKTEEKLGKRVRIHKIKCGSVRRGLRSKLPVWSYLIDHPNGLVLVDTGPDSAIVGKLADLGYRPEDLSYVVATNYDPEHIGGLRAVSNAAHLLVSDDEQYWTHRTVFSLRQPKKNWEGLPMEAFYFRRGPVGPVHYSYDLWGDGSVTFVLCPGHTYGTFAVVVRGYAKKSSPETRSADYLCTDHAGMIDQMAIYNALLYSGKVILASNVVIRADTWEESSVFVKGHQKASVEWLRREAAMPDCVAVLPTHDPTIEEGFINL